MKTERALIPPAARPALEAFVRPAVLSDTGINGKVLIAANEPEVASLLAYCLTAAGFRVRVSESAADAVREVARFFPDLVLLQSQAPDFGSTELWRQIRAGVVSTERQPAVVMFIGNEDDIDPRLGLEFGPCDFVLYPFCVRDLVLRVDGIIRARYAAGMRTAEPARRRHYLVGPLELDVDKHVVLVGGVVVQLSSLQMRVVTDLVEHRGHIRSREALLADVWGYHGDVSTRTADIQMNRLRNKLGVAAPLIETVRGVGYRLSGEHPVVMKDEVGFLPPSNFGRSRGKRYRE